MLRAEKLGVRFGRFQAVEDVSVAFAGPGVHSVIGPNGAGKTTFFNALSGVIRPSSGKIFNQERDITNSSPARRLSQGIARSFQLTSLFEEETVRENIRIAVQAKQGNRWAFLRGTEHDRAAARRVREVIDIFRLEKYADTPLGQLSHGLKRIVDISLCVAGDAETVLLDEPTSGVGIDDVPRIRSLIESLGHDRLVVLIEHNMSVVLGISKTVSVLVGGRLLMTGAPREVQRSKDVQAAYLGKKHASN
jgi:branched-chain amino acid transport system ATP-binding protein